MESWKSAFNSAFIHRGASCSHQYFLQAYENRLNFFITLPHSKGKENKSGKRYNRKSQTLKQEYYQNLNIPVYKSNEYTFPNHKFWVILQTYTPVPVPNVHQIVIVYFYIKFQQKSWFGLSNYK